MHLDYDLSEINLVYWRRCLDVLSYTQSAVRHVTITVLTWAVTGTSYFEPLASLDWDLLDQHLHRYTQLETINICIKSRNIAQWILTVDDMMTQLRGKFSARHQHMLSVEFGDSHIME